jgi:hypothetical protein
MNLDSLRQRILGATTTVTLSDGSTWKLAKLNAADGIAIGKQATEVAKDNPDTELSLDWYALILSKSILDENGVKQLDSDEGRKLLLQLPREDFLALGDAAVEWQQGSKKNLATKNDSPTSSALPSGEITLTSSSPI